MTTPRFEHGAHTDPGQDPEKQVNEDSLIDAEVPVGHVFVVCDGMGGHVGGKEASTRACARIVEALQEEPADASPRAALKRSIAAANAAVWGIRVPEVGHGRPGATVVALLMHAGGIEVAHAGDSRIYYIHHGQISQITRDHSKVQLLVDIGAIKAEEAKSHPETHQIFAALGIAEQVDVDMKAPTVAFVEGDMFVLCSDGLCDLVEAPEIRDFAVANPPRVAAEKLVALANERGGHDNITVSILRTLDAAIAPTRTETLVDVANVPPGPSEATEPLRTQVMASQSPPDHASAPRVQVPPPTSSIPLPLHAEEDTRKSSRPTNALFLSALAFAVVLGGLVAYLALRTRHSHHHHRPEVGAAEPTLVPATSSPPAEPENVPIAPVPSGKNPFLEALPTATVTGPVIPNDPPSPISGSATPSSHPSGSNAPRSSRDAQ